MKKKRRKNIYQKLLRLARRNPKWKVERLPFIHGNPAIRGEKVSWGDDYTREKNSSR